MMSSAGAHTREPLAAFLITPLLAILALLLEWSATREVAQARPSRGVHSMGEDRSLTPMT